MSYRESIVELEQARVSAKEAAKAAKQRVTEITRIVYKYRLGYIHTSHLYVNNYHIEGLDIKVGYEWGNAGDYADITYPVAFLDMQEDELIELLESEGPCEAQRFRDAREYVARTRLEFDAASEHLKSVTPPPGSERTEVYIEALENFVRLYRILNK